jgi:hypothetical protein
VRGLLVKATDGNARLNCKSISPRISHTSGSADAVAPAAVAVADRELVIGSVSGGGSIGSAGSSGTDGPTMKLERRNYQMSSLDMLATCPLLASITTLYSRAGCLKAYMPCASLRPFTNTVSLFSSTNCTGIPRATWPSVNRNLHTTLSSVSFLHWMRRLDELAALDRENVSKTAATLIADFMSVLHL